MFTSKGPNRSAELLCFATLSFAGVACSENSGPSSRPADAPISQKQDVFVVEREGKQHLLTASGEVGKQGYDEIEYDPAIGKVVGKGKDEHGVSVVQVLNEWTGSPAHEKTYTQFVSRDGGIIYGIREGCSCFCCSSIEEPVALDLNPPEPEIVAP